MYIVVIDLRDIRVTDNDEREAAEGNYSFRKVNREDRAGVSSRGEEGLWGKGGAAVTNNNGGIKCK